MTMSRGPRSHPKRARSRSSLSLQPPIPPAQPIVLTPRNFLRRPHDMPAPCARIDQDHPQAPRRRANTAPPPIVPARIARHPSRKLIVWRKGRGRMHQKSLQKKTGENLDGTQAEPSSDTPAPAQKRPPYRGRGPRKLGKGWGERGSHFSGGPEAGQRPPPVLTVGKAGESRNPGHGAGYDQPAAR
jgi:hypothetical protein